MKPLHRVLPSLALLLTGVASQAPHSTEQAEPSTGWSPGEQLGSVTIHRDQWGVPHIFADLEEDGFYGLGYALAEDQLELILRLFLAGRGELAAAYGDETSTPVADWVAVDARSLLWRHAEEGRADESSPASPSWP